MTRQIVLFALAAAACGDVTGPGGGGRSDGGPDGGPDLDAAVPGTVQVTVLDVDGTREPLAEVPVLFYQPDGTLEDTVDTDGDGVASAELLPGGAVIALVTLPVKAGLLQPQILATVGVKPGDEIVLGGRMDPGPATGHTMSFDLPPIKAAVDQYVVESPCGESSSGAEPVAIPLHETCIGAPMSIVAYAVVGADRYVVTDTNIAVENEAVVVVGGDWALVPSPDITTENLGDASFLEQRWARAQLDGVTLELNLPNTGSEATSDQLTLTPQKVVQPDHVQLQAFIGSEQPSAGFQLWQIWSVGDGDDDDLVIDADDYRMPWVGKPAFDQATRRFGWARNGAGTWDATYLQFNWLSEGKGGVYGQVFVAVPPGVHEVVLPEVPDEYKEWLPDDLAELNPGVILFDADGLDWDQVRQHGVDPMRFDFTARFGEPTTMRYSTSFSGG